MNAWQVNVVTAFGRGETLALALQQSGFHVQIIDFTWAFPATWQRGAGPFPILRQDLLPAHQRFLDATHELPRGLTFWLRHGPIELAGPMAEYFAAHRPAVAQLQRSRLSESFDESWLRRFLLAWTSPRHYESWEVEGDASAFPHSETLAMLAESRESRVFSFERYQALGYDYIEGQGLIDVQFDGQRITELEFNGGRSIAVKAPQWVWCLTGQETEMLGRDVTERLFPRGIAYAEWHWLGFQGRSLRGPWSRGFPEYSVVIDDVHLPWSYDNAFVLRWIDPDVFHVWIKVPAPAARLTEKQHQWADRIDAVLEARLPQAEMKLVRDQWWLCPHSPVFADAQRNDKPPQWKNWDWIAPETMSRLDLSARWELEATAFLRLEAWRKEQMKKQGARGDRTLHAP